MKLLGCNNVMHVGFRVRQFLYKLENPVIDLNRAFKLMKCAFCLVLLYLLAIGGEILFIWYMGIKLFHLNLTYNDIKLEKRKVT